MTFDQIVAKVMDRLNLTSDDARDRVGERVNEVYRDVTTSIGLITSRRVVSDVEIDFDEDGLPDYVVEDMEKILKITRVAESGNIHILKELTYDDLTNVVTNEAIPRAWATKRVGSGEVTITFDAVPTEGSFSLKIEGYETTDELVDDAEPAIPQSFHDLIVEGVMALELRKMEKPALAAIAEDKYARRLSDLRMFIAKSAYIDIIQGKNRPSSSWYRQWVTRTSMFN